MNGQNGTRCLACVIACAALTTTLTLGGCAKPSVSLADVELADISLDRIDLVLDFAVDNPNPVGMNLAGLSYALTADEHGLADGKVTESGAVPASGVGHVKVPVSLAYEALRPLWKALAAHEAVPYELDAAFDFGSYGVPVSIPFKHSGSIPPLYPPKWGIKDVRLAGVDTVEVLLAVENPNSFDLPLEGLVGKLTYGGETLFDMSQSSLPAVAAGRSATLKIPVRLDSAGLKKVASRLVTGSIGAGGFGFDGDLKMSLPAAVRNMLLGKGE